MKLVELNKLFQIEYGNQFDYNKMEASTGDGINYVSRSSQNLGVISRVNKYNDIEPFEAGLITVTLGGTYLLSSFIQMEPFYTGQNIKVLRPLKKMRFAEKIFYCKAIEANRYKYTSHGREANSTLDFLLVPATVPKQIALIETDEYLNQKNDLPKSKVLFDLKDRKWKTFKYGGLEGVFNIKNGYYNKKPEHTEEGNIPFIGATEFNNGVTENYSLFDIENTNKDERSVEHEIDQKIFEGNCITVANNGASVGFAFYQEKNFTCSHDVNVLYLKNHNLNKYIAIFLCTLIFLEKYRWDYGRKWRPSRMPFSEIKLPVDRHGKPDWVFMEKYIKTLAYSASI